MTNKIHFIGIGGIGLSALARFLKFRGFSITGSDMKESPITKTLKDFLIVPVPEQGASKSILSNFLSLNLKPLA